MQSPAATSDALEVSDPRAVALLLDEHEMRLLRPFFGGATVSGAARELGRPVYFVYRRVRHWLDLGLVREVQSVPRRGRPQRSYRTVTPAFHVRADHIPLEDALRQDDARRHREWIEHVILLATRIAGQEEFGWRVELDAATGRVVGNLTRRTATWMMLDQHDPAALDEFLRLRLEPADAKSLQRDLVALLGRYRERTRPDAPTYLLRVGMVEAQDMAEGRSQP